VGFKSSLGGIFRNSFSENIFIQKYRHEGCETWPDLCKVLVEDVCRDKLIQEEKEQLIQYMADGKFLAGGRYIYYAGRQFKSFNNCFLIRALEDTREDWAELSRKAELCLSVGGGIGVDYSVYRHSGLPLKRTGGVASGPIAKMQMVNEQGRQIMQGGSRRSAIYASLNWRHGDIRQFLNSKNWHNVPVAGTDKTIADLKFADFNFHAPLDFTNISVNYDTQWLLNFWKTKDVGEVFLDNIKQGLYTAEPGFSFNFFDKENETLRNACCEVTSEDDSDVCNLGSVNLDRIETLEEFGSVVNLATKFLLCGTLVADLPYEKVKTIREKNRRLGLGLMGMHNWLVKRGYKYEVVPELHKWLHVYKHVSRATANTFSNKLSISNPVACRAIAPTGTISIMVGASSGIEPCYAVAYKRRYLKGKTWHHEYVVDSVAEDLIEQYGTSPDKIESAVDLAKDYERRIKFQADVQDYVDQAISSTINLEAWGTKYNNEDTIKPFAQTLANYAHRLRGWTMYPNGARGGQPLTSVPYKEAKSKIGEVFVETHDSCLLNQHGGHCGV